MSTAFIIRNFAVLFLYTMGFSPGAKGWIKKYQNLLDKKEIIAAANVPLSDTLEHTQHLIFSKSGIVFGHVSGYIFIKKVSDRKWTNAEKLQLLLLESLFTIFIDEGNDPVNDFEWFLDNLLEFYGKHSTASVSNLFSLFIKEGKYEKLEKILSKRVDVKLNLFEHSMWINFLSNAFVYLDVILFKQFLKGEDFKEYEYDDYALNAIFAIILAAYADDVVYEKEKNIFRAFLASANLEEDYKNIALEKFRTGADFYDFYPSITTDYGFKRFLLDIAALTIHATHLVTENEKLFLKSLSDFLKIPEEELHESYVMVQNFVLHNNDYITYLQDNNSYEKVFGNLSSKWIKILGRNKDKLANELKESKELVFLISKSTTTELSREEKEKVKSHFLDLVKSVPALAIFMLPGGVVLLPLVLKIIPTLVPSAFRNNEIEE